MEEQSKHHDTPHAVDLQFEAERRRLSLSGLRAYFKIMSCWGVTGEEARQFLDVGSVEDYELLHLNPKGQILKETQMYRNSYMIGIYKALHILYGVDLADQWIRLPNSNEILGGQTPLAYMIHGGIPAMRTIRRMLDARSQGY